MSRRHHTLCYNPESRTWERVQHSWTFANLRSDFPPAEKAGKSCEATCTSEGEAVRSSQATHNTRARAWSLSNLQNVTCRLEMVWSFQLLLTTSLLLSLYGQFVLHKFVITFWLQSILGNLDMWNVGPKSLASGMSARPDFREFIYDRYVGVEVAIWYWA